jgi:hypothetical protein
MILHPLLAKLRNQASGRNENKTVYLNMRKSQLTTGQKVYVVNVGHFVSLSVFTVALRNYFFNMISYDLEVILGKLDDTGFMGTFIDDSWEELATELVAVSNPFPKMTKALAEDILKESLLFYGRYGQFELGHFEASYERGKVFNECGELAREFIKKKFPHLIDNES